MGMTTIRKKVNSSVKCLEPCDQESVEVIKDIRREGRPTVGKKGG